MTASYIKAVSGAVCRVQDVATKNKRADPGVDPGTQRNGKQLARILQSTFIKCHWALEN